MFLAFDIGNTNIVIGAFKGETLIQELRLKTDPGRTLDEYGALIITLLTQKLGVGFKFKSAAICSVAPPVTPGIAEFVRRNLEIEPLIIDPDTKTGVPIHISEPSSVGADRIVNVVAAKKYYGCPALVIDFGTATSFDLVGPAGAFEGGIISPGVMTALEGLVRNTAKLPRIELVWPQSLIGKSTVAAMQVGAVAGYCYMVDGLIDGIEAEIGPIPHIIGTGGLGAVFTKHSKRIKHYDPYLTLQGIRLVAEMNSDHK